jgi:hypothetical protein
VSTRLVASGGEKPIYWVSGSQRFRRIQTLPSQHSSQSRVSLRPQPVAAVDVATFRTGTDRASQGGQGGRSVMVIHNRDKTREFLISRRAKIRPDQGNLSGVSESVPEALAAALHLDEAERVHLFDLARAATTRPRSRRAPGEQRVRPSVQQTLDAMAGVPAYVRNGRRDILAANRLGFALYSELYLDAARPVNVARFVFLNRRAHTFFLDWERAADNLVAILRSEAGRNPYDRGLSDLVGELSTRSDEFATRWATHNVRFHRTGFKDIHHPIVGDLHLTFEALGLPADPGLSIVVYSAEVGSSSADGLTLLASWAATLDQADLTDASVWSDQQHLETHDTQQT